MPKRERKLQMRLTRKALNLWGTGLTRPEIASRLGTSVESVERLLRPLGISERVPPKQELNKHERKTDMSIPSYETDPSWTPSSVEEAIELAADLTNNGVNPKDVPGAFGDFADLAADLPFIWSEATPVDMALAEGGFVEWSYGGSDAPTAYGQLLSINEGAGVGIVKPMTLDDGGNLVDTGQQKVTVALGLLVPSGKKPATPSNWPQTTRPVSPDPTASMSDEPTADLSDDELWQRYADDRSGETGRRRAEQRVVQAAQEREDYWREAAKRGEPLPRDLSELGDADLTEEDESLISRGLKYLFGKDGA